MSTESSTDASSSSKHWWQGSVGYQIYIRSFSDSNGDGVGDLKGIQGRLDYLADLGIDFVWITPIYPSPMADWGYDVADYCDVDPLFGTLADFDALIAAAHERNIKVLLDLVPNHSSDAHRWFQDALNGPDAKYRDYYIWADPAADGGPPNNWIGYFGGPAWSLDPTSGQYYLHLFLPQQPDLNWRNPAVLDEFDQILRFWLDRGTDGFRIDVAGGLVKDDQLRSNPQIAPWNLSDGRAEQWLSFEHLYDVFQPESHTAFRRWRAVCDEYDAYLLGETYTNNPQVLADLVPGDGMHGGFWFEPMHVAWEADEIRSSLVDPIGPVGERLLWASGSHDRSRAPTRFADTSDSANSANSSANSSEIGQQRTLALNVLLSCLTGVPVLYQGEELGLIDGDISPQDLLDPVDNSRDVCRTPMPWTADDRNGFTTGDAWLKSEPRAEHETVAHQSNDPDSWLSLYTKLLAARRTLPALTNLPITWTDEGKGDVISYRRGPADAKTADSTANSVVNVAANTSAEPRLIELAATDTVGTGTTGTGTTGTARIVFATPDVEISSTGELQLPAYGAAIWQLADN